MSATEIAPAELPTNDATPLDAVTATRLQDEIAKQRTELERYKTAHEATMDELERLRAEKAAEEMRGLNLRAIPPLELSFSGDGTGMSFDDFSKQAIVKLEASGYPVNSYVRVLKGCLKGPALDFCIANKDVLPNTLPLESFLSFMKGGTWVDSSTSFALRQKCEQVAEGVTDTYMYSRKIQNALSGVPDKSEGEAIYFILKGLPDRLREKLLFDPKTGEFWKSANALLKHMMVVGADFRWPQAPFKPQGSQPPALGKRFERANNKTPTKQNGGGSGKGKPFKKAKLSDNPARTKLPPDEQARRMAKGLCFECGEAGHRSNDKDASGRWVCKKHA